MQFLTTLPLLSHWRLVAENKNIPLEMRRKMAWVVTDWINGTCGMERKETTEAVGCWSVWLEWKCNAVSGVSVRNECSSWNVMERKWKSHTASTWQTNNYMFFIFCTTDRWWGNFEALRAAERGKSVDIVRLLYIIRIWASPLICR